jgi:hypothetical protein
MICSICGIQTASVDEAIEQGWTPYFYDGDKQLEPACPNCSEALLQMSEDGEMEVKEEFRGKLRYMEQRRDEAGQDHLLIGIAVLDNGPGKLN